MEAFQGIAAAMAEAADPVRLVATLAVGYAAMKLLGLMTSPYIPRVWVPLEPGERLLLT